MPDQEDDPYLDTAAAAELADVPLESFRVYLKRSRRRFNLHQELRPQDLPLPDLIIGRSPAWHQSTIETWKGNRAKPGRPPAGNS